MGGPDHHPLSAAAREHGLKLIIGAEITGIPAFNAPEREGAAKTGEGLFGGTRPASPSGPGDAGVAPTGVGDST